MYETGFLGLVHWDDDPEGWGNWRRLENACSRHMKEWKDSFMDGCLAAVWE